MFLCFTAFLTAVIQVYLVNVRWNNSNEVWKRLCTTVYIPTHTLPHRYLCLRLMEQQLRALSQWAGITGSDLPHLTQIVWRTGWPWNILLTVRRVSCEHTASTRRRGTSSNRFFTSKTSTGKRMTFKFNPAGYNNVTVGTVNNFCPRCNLMWCLS